MGKKYDWEQLVLEHLTVTGDASTELLKEMYGDGIDSDGVDWAGQWPVERVNARRAELWKEHLDRAGLTIGRKDT